MLVSINTVIDISHLMLSKSFEIDYLYSILCLKTCLVETEFLFINVIFLQQRLLKVLLLTNSLKENIKKNIFIKTIQNITLCIERYM